MGNVGQVLGPPFKLISPGVNIKPYPCCRVAHMAIDGALALRKKVKVGEEQIQSVECALHLDGPTLYRYPRTGLEGKFSIAYCVSTALSAGKVGLEEFSDEKIFDPIVQRLMKKVVDVRNPGEEEVITVRLKDGRSFSHSVTKAKGDARSNPLSDEEVFEKFKACAQKALPAKNIQFAVRQIGKLEGVKDFSKFMGRIMGVGRRP